MSLIAEAIFKNYPCKRRYTRPYAHEKKEGRRLPNQISAPGTRNSGAKYGRADGQGKLDASGCGSSGPLDWKEIRARMCSYSSGELSSNQIHTKKRCRVPQFHEDKSEEIVTTTSGCLQR